MNLIAFLLSLNLRDYPLEPSGFIPFGVQPLSPAKRGIEGLELSRIRLELQSFCLRVSSRLLGICPFGAPP